MKINLKKYWYLYYLGIGIIWYFISLGLYGDCALGLTKSTTTGFSCIGTKNVFFNFIMAILFWPIHIITLIFDLIRGVKR